MIMRIQSTVDLPLLSRELDVVRKELGKAGLYDKAMRQVDVFLVPFDDNMVFRCWSGDGNIAIPEVSMRRFREWFQRESTSLRDVLRHCYGHAYAETHREAVNTETFRAAFATPYSAACRQQYDTRLHVSVYAAQDAAEDFAEVFAEYVVWRGRLPRSWKTAAIQAKWDFIHSLTS
jgi:hypothetical protein